MSLCPFLTGHGVMVPGATPRDIVLRLNREIQAVLELADVRQRFAEGGLEITGGAPEALLKRDFEKYGRILSQVGVRPE